MKAIRFVRRSGMVVAMLLWVEMLSGCGGGGSLLGHNSNVVVYLQSTNVQSTLVMTVSPGEGLETDPNACSNTQVGICTERTFNSDSFVYDFTTNSTASDSPYYVYVRNVTNQAVSAVLTINMDSIQKLEITISVPANSVANYARVFRNSADNM